MTELITILQSLNSLISTFRDVAILIILILGIRYLGREIQKGIKQVPKWIADYFKLRENELRLRWAKGEKK